VLVVSRGDDQLLVLIGRRAWHFPQNEDGRYSGYHPADSGEALAYLDASRAKGAQYLVLAATAMCGSSKSLSASDASIIVPCHSGAALTEACLTALTEALPRDFRGEIIVVDDASTDDTREWLERWTKSDKRISVRRHRNNAGFLNACNRAANVATRNYLVFLNNDTEPCEGWLTALLDAFRRFPNVGAVGGKPILPDGTLQEAGSVIFQDGSAANFKRGEIDLESPLINYVREVDYCSGALLATPRRLFAELGGFDEDYRPAYCEDVDYCFKVRQVGQRVYYQPGSKVILLEGGICGTDVTRGVKRHQVRNQQTFVERWSAVLDRQPARPPAGAAKAWHELAEWQDAESLGSR
jgi:GT2 family glycosyltransferase